MSAANHLHPETRQRFKRLVALLNQRWAMKVKALTGPTIGTCRLGFRKALAARKRWFPSVKDLPVPERNLVDNVSDTCDHGTLSGTTNGVRPGSANALSQVTVAQAWGSWLPWTMTTTGSDRVHTCNRLPNKNYRSAILINDRLNGWTWNTSSPPPTENFDWNKSENFSSMTDSVPFFSARLIFLNCMFLYKAKKKKKWFWNENNISKRLEDRGLKFSLQKINETGTNRNETESCRDAFWYSIVPVLFKISPEASPLAILSFFSNVLACCSLMIDTVTCNHYDSFVLIASR